MGLDVLRGLAIFGILVVNVNQMFIPEDLSSHPVAMIPNEVGAGFAWLFTDSLFDLKFFTLFSLLFGAGFALQYMRTGESALGFRHLYWRRIAVLLAFGLIHGAFFYAADVLAIYALTAVVLLALKRRSIRAQLRIGVVLLLFYNGWALLLVGPEEPDLASQNRSVVAAITNIKETGTVAFSGSDTTYALPVPYQALKWAIDGPGHTSQDKGKAQFIAFSSGPLAAANFSRIDSLAGLLIVYFPLMLFWRVLALFLIASGLVRWGILSRDRDGTWRRMVAVGCVVGLPMTIAATTLRAIDYETQTSMAYFSQFLHEISSYLLAMSMVGGVLLWCRNTGGLLKRGLESVGRTALTNYIGQSMVMSIIATSYGLGLYGYLSRLQLIGLSLVVFGLQMVLSTWWIRRFQMGPLEWIWRCLTYWRLLPLRRMRGHVSCGMAGY